MTDEIILKKPEESNNSFRIDDMIEAECGMCLIQFTDTKTGQKNYGAMPMRELKGVGFKKGDVVKLLWDINLSDGKVMKHTSPDDGLPRKIIKRMDGSTQSVVSFEERTRHLAKTPSFG